MMMIVNQVKDRRMSKEITERLKIKLHVMQYIYIADLSVTLFVCWDGRGAQKHSI